MTVDDDFVLRLPVVVEGGSFVIIEIPRLSPMSFAFLKKMLDVYRPAIVREKNDDGCAAAKTMGAQQGVFTGDELT